MIYLKILIFLLFHLNIYFSLLRFVITHCDQYMFNSEIHFKNTRQLQIFVNQYWIYHCIKKGFLIWILKSPGTDKIPAKLIKAGGITFRYNIHKLIISIWNKEDLLEERKEAIIIPMYQKGDKTDCSNYTGI